MHEWHSNLPRFLNVFSKKLKSNANNASLSHLKMMMTNYNSTRFLSFIFFCWRIAFSVSCSKFPLSPNIMVNCIYTTNNSLKSLLCSLDSSEVELSISGSITWSVVSSHYSGIVWATARLRSVYVSGRIIRSLHEKIVIFENDFVLIKFLTSGIKVKLISIFCFSCSFKTDPWLGHFQVF